jgi:hypothetical protein
VCSDVPEGYDWRRIVSAFFGSWVFKRHNCKDCLADTDVQKSVVFFILRKKGGASDAELVFGAPTASCDALFGKSHLEISDLKSVKGVDSKHAYQTLISTDYEHHFQSCAGPTQPVAPHQCRTRLS